MTKPDKIYLDNTNIMYALGFETKNVGTIRETFFYNQLKTIVPVNTSKESDFFIDNTFTFEVGGKKKTGKQIKSIAKSYIASDELEVGFGNKIPLWLFGFLY